MTTDTSQAIIDDTARTMGVSPESVTNMFAFMDQAKAQHGEQWRSVYPTELLKLVRDKTPWAVEVVSAMVASEVAEAFALRSDRT
ncbi:hypothetical protein ABZ383_33775 [Streptomyces sp. NPDC005900]|uniref:hypothetical protein n=1 Tax=Streptomyces sp. NPDC005900 TaxID=3154569 RepID=UPI00340CC549